MIPVSLGMLLKRWRKPRIDEADPDDNANDQDTTGMRPLHAFPAEGGSAVLRAGDAEPQTAVMLDEGAVHVRFVGADHPHAARIRGNGIQRCVAAWSVCPRRHGPGGAVPLLDERGPCADFAVLVGPANSPELMGA